MKSFLSHNWYKLMIASSFLIFSIGFLLYAISPSYANTNEEKINTSINSPNYMENAFAVTSNGYLYVFSSKAQMYGWSSGGKYNNGTPQYKWVGNELWYMNEDGTNGNSGYNGYKIKLP